uniref:Myb/SANT-like domain-containing protein n=1 Tax=Noccaea caerulescens TaxID=107243 RepID=A0A1J3GC26_NOCCA
MDQYGFPVQRREMKHKGRNVVWSVGMDKCLIEALAVQAKNGNKIDKCFNEQAYSAACVAVNARFNRNLNNQKVINRLKTIKKRYKVMKDILSRDGFWWNSSTKMIDCDSDEIWRRYIAVHPDAKAFKGKQIEMYEELKIVCGDNNQAPARYNKVKTESNHHLNDFKRFEEDSFSFPLPSSEDLSDTDGTESYTEADEYLHEETQNLPPPPPPPLNPLRQPPIKRPRDSDPFQEAMLEIASSIRRLADAVDQSKTLINTEELLEAVMEIDGLVEAKQMYAFEYLNGDPVKARAFMAYNSRMRKLFLFRQFWWWK